MRDLADAFQRMADNAGKQATAIESIADGDLTTELALRSENDAVGKALRDMLNINNDVFRSVNETASQVAEASRQIADGAQELAKGSTEQAGVAEELSATISTIASQASENAEMAGKAVDLGKSILANAEAGSDQMKQLLLAVKDIIGAGNDIAGVIKVIDDIAFQTNILALNAAVEAARAGQHGKGFAVVADEVRNLAGKSANAAKETNLLISNSIEKAELGGKIADDTAKSLSEIVKGINVSEKLVEDIAVASGESRDIIEQVNASVNQMSEVVQQNSAAAEQNAATGEELNRHSETLQALVGRFKLADFEDRRRLSGN
jgi:methyl-accepting chemotaxis protein